MLTQYGFNAIYPYLGMWGTVFLQTVFFIIIVRIGFAFVLKIFRKNLDYHALQSRQHTIKTRDLYNAELEKQRLFKDID